MGSKTGERENATEKKLEGANGTPSKKGALGYGDILEYHKHIQGGSSNENGISSLEGRSAEKENGLESAL